MISILEAKLQDVVTTKEAEIHRSTVALQNQLAVKDRTIQLLTLSVKEVEDKFKKSSKVRNASSVTLFRMSFEFSGIQLYQAFVI